MLWCSPRSSDQDSVMLQVATSLIYSIFIFLHLLFLKGRALFYACVFCTCCFFSQCRLSSIVPQSCSLKISAHVLPPPGRPPRVVQRPLSMCTPLAAADCCVAVVPKEIRKFLSAGDLGFILYPHWLRVRPLWGRVKWVHEGRHCSQNE